MQKIIQSLIHRIPLSWTILLSIGLLTALYSFTQPRFVKWKARRNQRIRARRFEKTLSEVDAGTLASASLSAKKKRKQLGGESNTPTAKPAPSASPRKATAALPPSTPTPSSKKQAPTTGSRPRAPSTTSSCNPTPLRKTLASSSSTQIDSPPVIDTSDFEPVVAKHRVKSARRVSSAAASASLFNAGPSGTLQVPSGESSAGSSNGDDVRKELAETSLMISKLRVEIGVAKAQEGKARSEAELARESQERIKEEIETLKKEHEARILQAQKREASVHHRLHSLSNQYAQLIQRHQALEVAFHDMATRISPMPSPHLGQNHTPIYPIAVSMPSPIPMRHPSYGYPSPMANQPYPTSQPYLQPPPQFRRPSGPLMSPAASLPTSGDHELKKNVEWSVLKRNPDRPTSGSDSTPDSTRASSDAGLEADRSDPPIHGLGMGDLGHPEQSIVQSPTATVSTPPPERDSLSPETETTPEFFPPVFPCVSHTREQLAELALLQKNAAEQQRQQKRKDSLGTLRNGDLPMTPSPSASPSIKGMSTLDLLAVESDTHSVDTQHA